MLCISNHILGETLHTAKNSNVEHGSSHPVYFAGQPLLKAANFQIFTFKLTKKYVSEGTQQIVCFAQGSDCDSSIQQK